MAWQCQRKKVWILGKLIPFIVSTQEPRYAFLCKGVNRKWIYALAGLLKLK